MNYYELIYLQKEFKNKLTDCWVERAITPFKNQLEIFIAGDKKSFRLIFNASSGNETLFLDAYNPPKKSNTIHFFDQIYGVPVLDIELTKHDRIISIVFSNEYRLWFKLFGNKANVLLSKEGEIISSFKDQGDIGQKIPEGKNTALFQIPEHYKGTRDLVTKLNPMFPRTNLAELIRINHWESKSPEEVCSELQKIMEQIETQPVFRVLNSGLVTMIDEQFLPVATKVNKQSINELVQYRFKNYAKTRRLQQRKKGYEKVLNQKIKRLESSLRNLEKAEKGLEKSGLYEKYGHLLMAHSHKPAPQISLISIDDFYEEGQQVQISVDSTLTMVENAERYYEKSANSKASYEEAKHRVPILRERLNKLVKMQGELLEIEYYDQLNDWQKKFRFDLESLNLGKKKNKEQNLPFHTVELNGYQIWIGKNAKSNDKLIQLSHKEDVWMHARGVPGSHLIIRMKNNKNMPDASLIDQAASYAAFNSKAKGSKLVPVIFTKKKYVRKPKGAAPGAVTVQKEQVTIVEPADPTE